MTVSIVELTNDLRSFDRDPAYNPNVFSESDDEIPGAQIYFPFDLLQPYEGTLCTTGVLGAPHGSRSH